ncbi:MAG: bifunctional folylpolyglutamate synthase/dihydrofolate synthase [Oscillospiraceae bacterium]|jgi:dihydrofolate synthase/folylpolyglutamate synthase
MILFIDTMTGATNLTADEALRFIHEKVWQGSKPGLSRTRELLQKMGDPQRALRFVHIAGTNGKGSVAAMLASVFRAAGYVTGLYTSPYIADFCERMQVNGEPIPKGELAETTEFCAPLALSMEDRPTEFELVTAVAMEFFKRRGCEIVVLETGLGGRLDSTNVIESPLCSVIMNIGLDHTKELGGTLVKIAAEKAGILKPGCPAVCYDLPQDLRAVFEAKAAETGSPLVFSDFSRVSSLRDSRAGQVFSYKGFSALQLPLLGRHQLKNAAVALDTVETLRRGGLAVSDEAVRRGLAAVRWPARFEILSEKPFFVVDGGHNPQCAETVAENLRTYFPAMRRVLLLGVLLDKDYAKLADILDPLADEYITIAPDNPRALSAEALAEYLRRFGKPVTACQSIEAGVKAALDAAGTDGMVCSVGSLYTAGRVRACFGR